MDWTEFQSLRFLKISTLFVQNQMQVIHLKDFFLNCVMPAPRIIGPSKIRLTDRPPPLALFSDIFVPPVVQYAKSVASLANMLHQVESIESFSFFAKSTYFCNFALLTFKV